MELNDNVSRALVTGLSGLVLCRLFGDRRP